MAWNRIDNKPLSRKNGDVVHWRIHALSHRFKWVNCTTTAVPNSKMAQIGFNLMSPALGQSSSSKFRLRCCPCPIRWGWQHQATSNTFSPFLSVLWISFSKVTRFDISLHTFRPCLPRPTLFSQAMNHKVCDRFDTGLGPLYMAIPSETPTGKDWLYIWRLSF